MNPQTETPLNPSRRDFLTTAAVAGAAIFSGITPRGRAAPAATPAIPAPAATVEATCIHAFAKPMQSLSYDATAALCAENGYGGIDFTVRPGGHVVPERVEEDLPRAVEAARKRGLQVQMITTAIVDPRDRYTEPTLKTAAKLGIKFYRLGSLDYDARTNPWETLQKIKPALKDLAAMNAQYGLHGAYQNHAGPRVGGPVVDLYELLRDLDPRWLGCQYDIRHATVEGGGAWPVGFRLLAPWIKCTDFKDFKWEQAVGRATPRTVPAGEGIVDFERYFKLAADLKVRGPISIHFEYPPFERLPKPLPENEKWTQCAAAMRQDLQFLKRYLAKYQIA
jgi:L-ribulose-5-phosphate 3-epimerase